MPEARCHRPEISAFRELALEGAIVPIQLFRDRKGLRDPCGRHDHHSGLVCDNAVAVCDEDAPASDGLTDSNDIYPVLA